MRIGSARRCNRPRDREFSFDREAVVESNSQCLLLTQSGLFGSVLCSWNFGKLAPGIIDYVRRQEIHHFERDPVSDAIGGD